MALIFTSYCFPVYFILDCYYSLVAKIDLEVESVTRNPSKYQNSEEKCFEEAL